MSAQEKIVKLQTFIANNRALAGVPFAIIHGRQLTPITALSMLQLNQEVPSVIAALATLGVDPPTLTNTDWALAEAYYQDLLAIPTKSPKIYQIKTGMSLEDALRHIQARDAIGRSLVQANVNLLAFMARRMQ